MPPAATRLNSGRCFKHYETVKTSVGKSTQDNKSFIIKHRSNSTFCIKCYARYGDNLLLVVWSLTTCKKDVAKEDMLNFYKFVEDSQTVRGVRMLPTSFCQPFSHQSVNSAKRKKTLGHQSKKIGNILFPQTIFGGYYTIIWKW